MKNYLADMAALGFGVPGQLSNLRDNIRTGQAQSGLLYGGAAAKEEARTVGQIQQANRLHASMQLADLTRQEAFLPQEIEALAADTEGALMGTATQQLTAPVNALSSLYGGAQSGLNSIFGVFGGMI